MGTTCKRRKGRSLRALTMTLLLALLTAAILAGTVLAADHEGMGKSAKPGTPTAKAPRGSIATTTPTFTWSKARGAAKYELRVYDGGEMLLKKTGITKLSWTSNTALTKDVSLTWKVRASGAGGAGAWSRSLTFKVLTGDLAIGDSYQGGKVAYILQSGEPGYVAGETHGLIVATADQSAGIQWCNGPNTTTGATATALGTGLANTNTIISSQADPTTYAAGVARSYEGGGYTDWYLPSKDELSKLYDLKALGFGGFESPTAIYWSSSEYDLDHAWSQAAFDTGGPDYILKNGGFQVRAVRSF